MIAEEHIKRPNESFVTLDGITKRYQICVRKEGVVDWRMRSCWCLVCTESLFNGTLEWGQTHTINNCMMASDTSGGQEMYSFDQMLCTKTVGPGVTALVQQRSGDRNEVAAGLVVGDFVLFDAHDDEVEPIWLGRVMSNPEWNGHGVYKNKDAKKVTFDGVGIGQGGFAVYVMW